MQVPRNLGTGNGIELLQGSLLPDIDFSGDGKVNFEDFSILAQYWSVDESSVDVTPPPLGDGKINYKDLAVLIVNWLTGTKIPPLLGPASNPSPSDSATGISSTADLSWTAGSDATSHDVYFGRAVHLRSRAIRLILYSTPAQWVLLLRITGVSIRSTAGAKPKVKSGASGLRDQGRAK